MASERRVVRLIGVPIDYGQSRRGVDMGPSAIRYAGLQARLRGLGLEVHDCGNILVPTVEEVSENEHDQANARHLAAVVSVCQSIYETAAAHVAEGEFAIFLGGDHSISVGSVASMTQRGRIGVIWVDAHGDFNTPESTPSGNVHGMALAALMGEVSPEMSNVGYPGPKLSPAQVAMVGVRNLDQIEKVRLAQSGIQVFTMTDIDEHGIAAITRQILATLEACDSIHVSLDMDALDPEFAAGVGTPDPGGLTYREAHLLMELLAQSGKVNSLDIVEINPILDNHNRTAELAVALAASLLGKRIMA